MAAPISAHLSTDAALLARFAVEGKAPRSVIVITIDETYFQCSRAIVRSQLWNPARHIDPGAIPTPGQILAELSDNRVGGVAYDQAWPARAAASLW